MRKKLFQKIIFLVLFPQCHCLYNRGWNILITMIFPKNSFIYHKTSFSAWIGLIFFASSSSLAHLLAASWSFWLKKLRMWIWSQTSSRNTNTTHFGSDCHITGNQIFFGWKKFIDFFLALTIFHYCLLNNLV